jgi:hypothetical protein
MARRELFWACLPTNFRLWCPKAGAGQVDRASACAQLGFTRAINSREGFWESRCGSLREDFWVPVAYLDVTLKCADSC